MSKVVPVCKHNVMTMCGACSLVQLTATQCLNSSCKKGNCYCILFCISDLETM